jgi:hypothetical protein
MSATKPRPPGPAQKEPEQALTVTEQQLPAHLQDLENVAGLGNSSDPSDSSLPFLAIIQSNSPQIKEE